MGFKDLTALSIFDNHSWKFNPFPWSEFKDVTTKGISLGEQQLQISTEIWMEDEMDPINFKFESG